MAVRLEPATGASGDSEATPSDREGGETGDRRWSTIKRQWPAALCFAVYVVLAMVVYGHFGSLGPGHMTGFIGPDETDQVWWLAWTAFALPHGHNVFSAQWQNYPAGENFGVNGSMLALGVLFMPITKLFGPVVTWNIALRLAVALSASSMCLVLRRWTTWWPAAFVGGLLYGFSAYMAYSDGNYLFLVFVPLPPVIFLLLHEILVRQHWRPGRTGALLGVVCTLQFFVWSEVLASTVVMGVAAVVLFLLVSRHQVAERLRYAVRAFAYSLGVGGFLLLFPVIYALAGPQSIRGTVASPATIALFPSDLFGAFVPSSQWAHSTQLTAIAQRSSALYLGLPLVVALALFAIFLRKRRSILFAGAMALIAFVLSLGPRLWVDGHETSISLPFVVFEHRPVVGALIPVRFSLYTALFVAAMFAVGLDELWRRMRRSDRPAWLSPRWRIVVTVGALAALTAAVVTPLAPRHTQPTTPTNVSSFVTTAAVEAIPAGSVVLAYPYPDFSGGLYFFAPYDIMLDQAVAGMRFKLIGGYGWFPSPRGTGNISSPSVLKPDSVQAIFDAAFHGNATAQMAPLSKSNVTALRVFLRKYDVQTVVVLPNGAYPAAVVSYVTAAIGPPVKSGGVTAWFHVKQRLLVDQVHVGTVANSSAEPLPKLVTDVFVPANDATLSGIAVLDAWATGYFLVTKVEFYLTSASQHDTLIGTATRTPYGWAIRWNTTTVANGTYQLQSVAYDVAGRSGHSNGITITVKN
jgi:Bacterial Ig domain